MTDKLDIIRTSASRPRFLQISTESLLERLKFNNGKLRWIIHEDMLDPELSSECVEYINRIGIYDVYQINKPPLGQGFSMNWLLSNVSTPYFFNVEDDWHLLKPINLNKMCTIMDNNPKINQIAFQKRPLAPGREGFTPKEVEYDGIKFTTNPHWAFTPALWRTSYIKRKWKVISNLDFHWEINRIIKNGKKIEETDADWVINNSGTYFLGQVVNKKMKKEFGGSMDIDEYSALDNGFYFQHLGQHRSQREGSFSSQTITKYPYKHENILEG